MIKPDEVKAKAQKLEEENYEFRTFLKCNADPDELDEQFAALHKELFADYDCCKCANCCKSLDIFLNEEEVERLASCTTISKSDFIALYLTKTNTDDEKLYKFSDYCLFLEGDGTCDIYDRRPQDCRSFPFTDQPDRLQSMLSIIGHAEVCPVVFEILERLKVEYGFRKKRK